MIGLREYDRKRDFKKTPEPRGKVAVGRKARTGSFVVQEHHASRLHYDFRLEIDGVLKSWSVPKGPSLDPKARRLAVQVEDHPLEYGKFSGEIPEGEYGAGEVFIWDKGLWTSEGDPRAAWRKGRIDFTLEGGRLKGRWLLVRTGAKDEKKPRWMLIKRTDGFARAGHEAERIADYGSRRERGAADFYPPMLATLVEQPPEGDEWIHETKYDGYRIQAWIRKGKVVLKTRTGQDWTARYGPVAESLAKLKADAVLDGEIVWVENGRFDFQSLQNATKTANRDPLVYAAFDLLSLGGRDIRESPLRERKKALAALLKTLPKSARKHVEYGDHLEGDAEELLLTSCRHEMEGIVSKRADSAYHAGRGELWLKSKCRMRQEFVIGGYTDPEGSRLAFGALLLGVYDKGRLRYAGRVGTGFDSKTLLTLRRKLKALGRKTPAFELNVPRGRGLHWVDPKLVAEVAFAGWTQDLRLRVPVFHGLREDKPAERIVMEKAKSARAPSALTHPEKILFRKEGLTKLDVAGYYDDVAELFLEYSGDRPLSLNRCPDGASGECFFQKHHSAKLPPSLPSISLKEKKGVREYITVHDRAGLRALVQMGAFEIHVWNSRRDTVMHPDQFVMDFDPGPGVPWTRVVQAAFELRELLERMHLKGFPKVTGGKGVHVHVPVKPLYAWDRIKELSRALALEMTARDPKSFTAKLGKDQRRGKIFIDYLRNGYGATAVAPYSLRAREVSAVAMPIAWDELPDLPSASTFTLEEALAWLKKRKRDPWADYRRSARRVGILDASGISPRAKKKSELFTGGFRP